MLRPKLATSLFFNLDMQNSNLLVAKLCLISGDLYSSLTFATFDPVYWQFNPSGPRDFGGKKQTTFSIHNKLMKY